MAVNKKAEKEPKYLGQLKHKLYYFLSLIRFFVALCFLTMICKISAFRVIWPFYFRPNITFCLFIFDRQGLLNFWAKIFGLFYIGPYIVQLNFKRRLRIWIGLPQESPRAKILTIDQIF